MKNSHTSFGCTKPRTGANLTAFRSSRPLLHHYLLNTSISIAYSHPAPSLTNESPHRNSKLQHSISSPTAAVPRATLAHADAAVVTAPRLGDGGRRSSPRQARAGWKDRDEAWRPSRVSARAVGSGCESTFEGAIACLCFRGAGPGPELRRRPRGASPRWARFWPAGGCRWGVSAAAGAIRGLMWDTKVGLTGVRVFGVGCACRLREWWFGFHPQTRARILADTVCHGFGECTGCVIEQK